MEEVLVHGLCEVIERDALAFWYWKGKRERQSTQISIPNLGIPAVEQLEDLMLRRCIRMNLRDATSNIGVPVVQAELTEINVQNSLFFPRRVAGGGCHPDSRVALIRAITEAAQARATLISGARDDLNDTHYPVFREQDAIDKSIESNACARMATRTFSRINDELGLLLDALSAVGFSQAIYVELPVPSQWGIKVCRVIVPGLEPKFRPQFQRPGARAMRQILRSGWLTSCTQPT